MMTTQKRNSSHIIQFGQKKTGQQAKKNTYVLNNVLGSNQYYVKINHEHVPWEKDI